MIRKDRIGNTIYRWRSRSFHVWPSIVSSASSFVDLLPGARANVIDKHSSGAGLKGKSEWIAQPKTIDRAVQSCRGVIERVVSRKGRFWICSIRILGDWINSQNFPKHCV